MGMLTDPGVGRGKITRLIIKSHDWLCLFLFVVGLLWFVVLASPNFNAGTYFSENALLPGLVTNEYADDMTAKNYYSELLEEVKRFPDGMPYSWLLAKFQQMALDTYTHNFTLNYPLGTGTKYTGKNVYAILRAPRSSSTESLVLSVPFRPPNSMHPSTMASVALMLSMAKFFRRQKYWAKDVIFLVTEHEQLGAQAWLEAYHKVTCGHSGVLDHGDMKGRAGSIQAAINLELHSDKLVNVDVKIEGLNGQLPNLDLVNLAHRMCNKEGVRHTFKNRGNPYFQNSVVQEWFYSFQTLMLMVTSQASGVPNGNHGLFHRFGIEALTLEGFERTGKGSPIVFYQMGRVIEGLFRSLNNLLERFHQSFFFYLLPSTDRYISIGMYMPPIGLFVGSLLIKAFALWLKMHVPCCIEEESETKEVGGGDSCCIQHEKHNEESSMNLLTVGITVLLTHAIGIALLSAPKLFSSWGHLYEITTSNSIFISYVAALGLLLFTPLVTNKLIGNNPDAFTLINIAAQMELATLILTVSMHNFSLALLGGTVYIPYALMIAPDNGRQIKSMLRFEWFILHPILLVTGIVSFYGILSSKGDNVHELFTILLQATSNSVTYSIIDCLVHGNWMFSIITSVLIPNWLLFWIILFSNAKGPSVSESSSKTKED